MPDLFTWAASPRARSTDHATSHAAARSMRSAADSHRRIILDVLNDHEGLTVQEITDRCELRHDQVNRRMAELHDAGAAMPTGETRLSASGRPARVWRVC